jgi:hypothetical protein
MLEVSEVFPTDPDATSIIGAADGATVAADCELIGAALGTTVGEAEGVAVGGAVGEAEGVAVGGAVGELVGAALGAAVGELVGAAVGVAIVGAEEGAEVGTAVVEHEEAPTPEKCPLGQLTHDVLVSLSNS